ncbi:MAG: hypothetical protein ACT4NV_11970 [Rhodoferax sp.]
MQSMGIRGSWLTGRGRWAWALALLACISAGVYATNYSLWINGRNNTSATAGNYADFIYWGPSSTAAGVNKKAVNWDGYNRVSTQNYRVRDALDCFCTGNNWCYIAVHSAGNLQIGYALSMYGGSTRNVTNASPGSGGTCTGTGSSQTGWNIKWVDVAAGAGGGSELANVGSWAVSDPLTSDLKTATARAMYDHSQTRSKWLYMYTGASGTLYSAVLPGQDDEAVAYHSSGGVSGSGGASFCNPSDWFCNDLTLGTAANEGGSAKWSFHSVKFRDDNESYNHYTNGNWGGVVSKVRADMAANAL